MWCYVLIMCRHVVAHHTIGGVGDSALKILHVGEDISSRGFFFFFPGFFGGGFPPFFFFFFGGLGWRIILLGVL